MSIIDLITLLLVLSAAFTLINIAYLKLPSTIGLMLIALISSALVLLVGILFPGIAQGAEHIIEEFEFKEVLLDIMLNFLLFAGALSMDLNTMIEEKVPIIILAVFGTLISTFVVGALVFYIFPLLGIEMDFIYCLLFGALISPTDPIAVLALLKKFNLSKNLEIKVAGESLFNDGVGVVVFLTILGVAERGMDTFDIGEVGILFGQEVFGGLLLGAILGYIGFKILLFIDNDYVELEVLVTLSLVMIGGRFAESIHVSAPLAMVILGLSIGNKGRDEKLANATGKYVFKFWHLLDETLNAMLFILIGLEIVLTGRSIGVSLPVGLMSLKIKFEKGATPLLIWGGLRGGISVALALSLSDFEWIPSNFKIIILFTTYCVVVFSILVQGLTIPALLRRIQ